MSTVIRAKNVSRYYGKKAALKNITCDINQGQIVGLLGPNGAGKTTLLQAIVGMQRTHGDLSVFNTNPWLNRTKILQQAAFIADVSCIPAWMSIKQLFILFSETYNSFLQDKAEKLLKSIDIDYNQKVKSLSKGMKAQLHLALAISVDLPLLILDEPTLGLDPLARDRFYNTIMEEFYTKLKTIIISSHQVDEIEPLLSHVIFLNNSEILLHDSAAEIKENYVILVTKNTSANINLAKNLQPVYQFKGIEQDTFLYNRDPGRESKLKTIGSLRQPSISELFKALN